MIPKLFIAELFPKIPIRSVSAVLITLGLSACGAGSGDNLDQAGQPIGEGGPVDNNDLFTNVQSIFTTNCIRCHAGASAPQGLSLAAGVSFDQIVGVASNQQPDLLRIDPGNPDDSYLLRKVLGTPGITGSQMPLGGPFLNADDIQTITDWIAAGAPPAAASSPTSPDDEVIAEITDFTNYRNWESVDYTIGLTNRFLTDGIHSSDNETFARRVYANDIALNSTGNDFDNGSILVKEVFTYANDGLQFEFAEGGGLLAMVKRGGNFSPNGGGWEWFNIRPDLSDFNARGVDVRMGTCLSCHASGVLDSEGDIIGGKDFVFEHPSEVAADDTTFANYRSWNLIDTLTTRPDLLGDRAHGGAVQESTRVVYKKQLYANPDTSDQGYPIGTALVKEARDADGNIIEVTAMLKRGGGFSPMFGDWEWFLLEAQTGTILCGDNGEERRGAFLNNGGCVGCHTGATPEQNTGIDFVFRHDGDPFNNNEEFAAEVSDFVGFESWDLVDYTIGAVNPTISGGAHQGAADLFARRVYANPTAMNFDGTTYPRGSIFVKAITSRETGTEVFPAEDGLIAMVKRGGTFNQ